jgi:hypothetical protein
MTPINFDGTADEWIRSLSKLESDTIQQMRAHGASLDDVALHWLTKAGPENTFPFGGATVPQGFYQRIKDELHKLICGDPSYEKLRKEIVGLMKNHKGKVVGMIAAALGASVGLSAVALVPVIALILSIVSQVGINAWCKNPTGVAAV